MPLEGLDELLRRLRRSALFQAGPGARSVAYDRAGIEKLVPHREPFLLIDAIDGIDLDRQCIRGRRRIATDDPVFEGHFPGTPVYPGVLLVEAMGQLALCLAGLRGERPAGARVTRIHHALFVEPVGPGDELTLEAGIIEDDGLAAISAAQVFKGRTLCACSVQEVVFVD